MFLDTQYHFAETLWYVEQVRARYDLNLNVVTPGVNPDDLWHNDPDACCRGPQGRAAATGARGQGRVDERAAPRRERRAARTPRIVSYDVGRGLVKVNPIATVDRPRRRAATCTDHDLPVHPLPERGYASIGCWPCTRPVGEGEDARAGRWAGSDKTECGLHS